MTPPPFELPAIARPPSQPAARLIVTPPVADALARGLVVIQYRAVNIRFVEVYGPEALQITPRVGHLHVSIDGAPWHWVDASGEPIIVQGLPAGSHSIRIDLADPTHHVIDSKTIEFQIPSPSATAPH
jgi:Family of unknown function (DUF6130)